MRKRLTVHRFPRIRRKQLEYLYKAMESKFHNYKIDLGKKITASKNFYILFICHKSQPITKQEDAINISKEIFDKELPFIHYDSNHYTLKLFFNDDDLLYLYNKYVIVDKNRYLTSLEPLYYKNKKVEYHYDITTPKELKPLLDETIEMLKQTEKAYLKENGIPYPEPSTFYTDVDPDNQNLSIYIISNNTKLHLSYFDKIKTLLAIDTNSMDIYTLIKNKRVCQLDMSTDYLKSIYTYLKLLTTK